MKTNYAKFIYIYNFQHKSLEKFIFHSILFYPLPPYIQCRIGEAGIIT